MGFRSRLPILFAGAVLFAALFAKNHAFAGETSAGEPAIVFAAASLKNALDGVSASWQKETGQAAKVSYAASSALARQIEAAAPADIFISADEDWMDYVASKGLIRPETRTDLLANKLVLVAPKDGPSTVELTPAAIAKVLGDGRLAMGSVESVPAGKYGKAALEKLGLWAGVSNRLAQAESVRAALLLVSRGETPLGIVYQTDAGAEPNVKIVATFPEGTHPPIVYPIALTKKASAPSAALLDYIKSPRAAPLFEAQGFTVLKEK